VRYSPPDTAGKIAEALGGPLVPDANGNYRCHCPSHSDTTPSLSVCDRGGKTLVRCFAGCRQSAVIEALQRLRFLPGTSNPNARVTAPMQPPKPAKPLWALDPLKPWREASPLIVGSLVETYLGGRCLALPESAPLRYSPFAWHWPTKSRHPAMVALIETHDWAPVTSHTTFLSHDGRKANIEPQRLFSAGAKPAGAGVWFTGLSSKTELAVAEGVESTLSAAHLYDAGACVATLSTHGMRTLVLPPSMRWPVRIFADNDRAGHGLAAARDLYRRLRSEGREVVVTLADAIGEDANDIWIRRQRS
jgi:putative DNA primase/helicase